MYLEGLFGKSVAAATALLPFLMLPFLLTETGETNESRSEFEPFTEEFSEEADGLEMIPVEGGAFRMNPACS